MTAGTAPPPPPRELCVVLHDVAPATWGACARVLDAIDAVARVPVTLLAVPRYHGGERSAPFERWLVEREAAGDEVALHGFTHRDDGRPRGWIDHLRRRHYTRSEGEFSALSRPEAERRLAAGEAWFGEMGLALHGFVAPAWLLNRASWDALDSHRFDYTCTLGSLFLLPERRRIRAQSLVYSTSSAWRRSMSLAWVASLAALSAGRPLLRLELHPSDAEFAPIKASWQGVLKSALASREAVTLSQAMRRRRARPPASEQAEHERGREQADGGADDHVARVVQAEHEA